MENFEQENRETDEIELKKWSRQREKKKHKGLRTALILLLCLVIAGLAGIGYFLYEKVNSGLFFEHTMLNGYDVSEKTCKEVLLILTEEYSAPQMELMEQGETAMTLSLADMGYTVDQKKLLSMIENCMMEQNMGLLFSLLNGNSYEVSVPFAFDETQFCETVSAQNLAQPRVASTDAVMEFNGTEYYIEPETYGNELDDADLQAVVKDQAQHLVQSERPAEDIQVEIPEALYFLPAVLQDDPEMNHLMNSYNSFCKAKICLTFGETEEVTDWSVIKEWLVMDGDELTLNEEPVYNYIYELAARYDTLYYSREFTTTDGRTLTFESSDYGYRMDKDAEAAQFIADIYSNTEVRRDPVYEVKGYARNGRDDLCGNYVEVDLTKQHLWMYKGGNLVIETDIVSGLPKDGRETATGVFTIPYKKSPEVLKGDTWEADVEYWMPFHDGQGLHDASWKSSFGGEIYKTSGSHGCVNLPPAAAKVIYENMEERYAIILYK